MIYASDLDRTLMYSESFLNECPCDDTMVLVDEASLNSYMASTVIAKLQDITNNTDTEFIPVTTRNIKQYKRIKIPGINPEYAITSNGGNILHNGEPLKEWSEIVNSQINKEELTGIADRIGKLPGICYKPTLVDGVFVFAKATDVEKVRPEINDIKLKYTEYALIIERSKIYVVPNAVSKEKALMWLKQKLGKKFIIASGDGEFDVGMLGVSDLAVLPQHNTISDSSKELIGYYIDTPGNALSAIKTLDIVRNISKER